MSVLEWKSQNLFNIVPSMALIKNKISCKTALISNYCCNISYYIFCDQQGYVYMFDNNFEKCISFRARTKDIQKCAVSKENIVLVLIVQDSEKNLSRLDVYDIQNLKMFKTEPPPCITNVQLNSLYSVSSLQLIVKGNILTIAIGCENGNIFFHQGALGDLSLNFRPFSVSDQPIIGIQFNGNNAMFIHTQGEIFCYTNVENICAERKVMLDQKNSNIECCSALQMTEKKEPYFIVGRKNAIYCFTTDGRGPCYALEGKKIGIAWYKNYLALLISEYLTSSTISVVVIDIDNKIIAYQRTITKAIGLLTNGMDCTILTADNELFILEEYSFQKRIQLCVNKSLYDIAFRFIQRNKFSEQLQANVYIKYGDYLISKSKFELAVQTYRKTIGIINPFIIIRKLVNFKLDDGLCQYLRYLVQSGWAKRKHKKLLFKCDKHAHLSSFVDMYLEDNAIYEFQPYITSHIAPINTCIKSKLKHISSDYLSSMLIAQLKESYANNFLLEHGRFLFDKFPQEIIKALQIIFATTRFLLESLTPLTLDNDENSKAFLELILNSDVNCSNSTYDALFELYLREWSLSRNDINVQQILKNYSDHLTELHTLLTCSFYGFWPNANYFVELSFQSRFYKRFFFKNFSEICENAIQDQSTEKKTFFQFGKHVVEGLCYLTRYLLNTGHNVSINTNFLMSSFKSVFNIFELNKETNKKNVKIIKSLLLKRKFTIRVLLMFLMCPIEIRTSLCSICQHETHFPAIYFMCEHVFHQECLRLRSRKDVCVICMNSIEHLCLPYKSSHCLNSLIEISNKKVIIKLKECFRNGISKHKFFRNYFKSVNDKCLYSKAMIRNENLMARSTISKNPFESSLITRSNDWRQFEEHDVNQNPFEIQ